MYMIRGFYKIIFVFLLLASHQLSLHAAEHKELIMCFKDGHEAWADTLRQNVINSSRMVSDLFTDESFVASQSVMIIPLPTIDCASVNKLVKPLLLDPGAENKKRISAFPAHDLAELIKINSILQFRGLSRETARSLLSQERVAQFIKQPIQFSCDVAPVQHELDVVHDLLHNLTSRLLVFDAPEILPINVDHLVLSRDGNKLVGRNKGHITVFDLLKKTTGPEYEYDCIPSSFVWNKDGTRFIVKNLGSMRTFIFDASQTQQPEKYEPPSIYDRIFGSNGVDFALTSTVSWGVEICTTTGGIPICSLPVPYGYDTTVVWNPANDKVATVSSHDYAVRVWDLATSTQLSKCHVIPGLRTNPLKWSPDGSKIAYYRHPRTMYIHDVASGELLHIKTMPGAGYVSEHAQYTADSLAWSPCGTMIVTSANNNTLLIWDVEIGQVIMTIELPEGDKRVFVSADWGTNNRLVVATNDCAVYAFDMNDSAKKLLKIMESKMSIAQIMLVAYILKYDTAPSIKWLSLLSRKQKSVKKALRKIRNNEEKYLLSLLYSLPPEVKNSLKQWLTKSFVIQKAQE